jgi:hypothetical protein
MGLVTCPEQPVVSKVEPRRRRKSKFLIFVLWLCVSPRHTAIFFTDSAMLSFTCRTIPVLLLSGTIYCSKVR